MIPFSPLRIALALIVCLAGGCHMFSEKELVKSHSPLQSASPSPDSVAMEIIWARFPANDPVLDDSAWSEIDETQINPTVRRELLDNGIRAGVIAGTVPPAIDRVLHQGKTSAGGGKKTAAKQMDEFTNDPIVHGNVRRLRRNQRAEIQASEVYPTLPLLLSSGGELGGRPFMQAQAIYALRVDPQPDHMALVELTPELHSGEPKLRFTGGEDGILRQIPLRERKVFDRMKVSVRLAPGETLVLMSRPNSGSRLGDCFHTVDSTDGPQHKLILIRLAEVPTSDTFALSP